LQPRSENPIRHPVISSRLTFPYEVSAYVTFIIRRGFPKPHGRFQKHPKPAQSVFHPDRSSFGPLHTGSGDRSRHSVDLRAQRLQPWRVRGGVIHTNFVDAAPRPCQ